MSTDGVSSRKRLTSRRLVFDRLLEQGDVSEGAEEKNHLVVFVFDRGHLHVEPDGCSCGTSETRAVRES